MDSVLTSCGSVQFAKATLLTMGHIGRFPYTTKSLTLLNQKHVQDRYVFIGKFDEMKCSLDEMPLAIHVSSEHDPYDSDGHGLLSATYQVGNCAVSINKGTDGYTGLSITNKSKRKRRRTLKLLEEAFK